MLDSANTPHIISVSELNRLAKEVLEQSFPLFWVSGEISNFTRAASGHWYFTLKDDRAQVKASKSKRKPAIRILENHRVNIPFTA